MKALFERNHLVKSVSWFSVAVTSEWRQNSKLNRMGLWGLKCHEIKIPYSVSRLMYFVLYLGQGFVFKFRVKFLHFFNFLRAALRRIAQDTAYIVFFSIALKLSPKISRCVLLHQPTTVDSSDFSSHVRCVIKIMVSQLRNTYYSTEDVVSVEYLPNTMM